MAGIAGMGTTFTLPNYHGRLFTVSPTDTKFLSAIGGLSGGESASATEFTWQTYDLRPGANDRQRLEGADAPAADNRVRVEVSNVVEIHHEKVDVSYTKQAAVGQFSGANVEGANPVQAELPWQMTQALKSIALDVETSFITGAYAKPADNTAPRKTRGIMEAITTNVYTGNDGAGGPVDLTETIVLDVMQDAWTSGGLREEETATLMVNASLKRALTKIFVKDAGYAEGSRSVGGVAVSTIQTDFGTLNVMLNRHMPTDALAILSLEVCRPRILLIPNKGFLFAEPLAKTGSSDAVQLYGEIGLEYGHEAQHAKIDNVKAPAGA